MEMSPFFIYLLTAIAGLMAGSFLNVCIFRIPAGEEIVFTPSHCPHCGKRLAWYELIPVLSWLALRGRCAGCRAAISPQYPLVEAGNAALWLAVVFFLGFTPEALLGCALTSALLGLSVIDGRTLIIPPGFNLFILLLAAVNLALNLDNWPAYAIGLVAVSVPLLAIFILTGGRGIGGGDVKLMAVCGLFLGWKYILVAFLLGCVLGSVIHLLRMRFTAADRVLAMGPYLALGVFITLLWGELLLGWYLALY